MSYISEVLADGPEMLWMLDDASGTVATALVRNASFPDGTYVGGPTLGAASPIAATTRAVQTTSSSNVTVPMPPYLPVPFTLEVVWEYVSGPGIVFRDNTTGAAGFRLDLSARSPVLRLNGVDHTVAGVSSASLKTGARHHFVLTDNIWILTLYIDGVAVGDWASDPYGAGGGNAIASPVVFGKDGAVATYSPGVYAGAAIYQGALSAARVAAHFAALGVRQLGTVNIPVAASTIQPQLRVLGTVNIPVTPGVLTIAHPYTTRSSLVLASSTVSNVTPAPDAPTRAIEPLHVVSPAVPAPTLVDGRPQ